jgi:hypothetical protein
MARWATDGDESGGSAVGQTFSLQTGFSRSLRRVLHALKPRAEWILPHHAGHDVRVSGEIGVHSAFKRVWERPSIRRGQITSGEVIR